jgi:hypothetical protein
MTRPSKWDVVGTLVSGVIELTLLGTWVYRRWFRVERSQ